MNRRDYGRLQRGGFITALIIAVVFIGFFVLVRVADGSILSPRKEKLPRGDVYYEITNDDGDHGNFIEIYRVPNGRGGKVYCVVYSDQIQESGGGAGISCDWEHS